MKGMERKRVRGRAAEIRQRGRARSEGSIMNRSSNSISSSRSSKVRRKTVNKIHKDRRSIIPVLLDDNNYDEDDDDDDDYEDESPPSRHSSASVYSLIENRKSERSTIKELLDEDLSVENSPAASSGNHQTHHRKKEPVTVLALMKRPSIYSWYSASLDTLDIISSRDNCFCL